MAVKKTTSKKVRSRKKPARKKVARKKPARKKAAQKQSTKPAESSSGNSDAFFILLDAPSSDAAPDNAIRLPADCRFDCVGELHGELASMLANGAPLTIDASAVKHVDGASLQLLFAFARDAANSGLTVEWKDVPDYLSRSATSLGLSAHLTSD